MALKISVIIPVYNVETYLQECLESVLDNFRKFGDDEAEAILIDDGSTDNSGRIISDFCEINRGFHYYYQCNKGLSEARNTGLTHAKGKYIFFLDSDDILEDDILIRLYAFAEQNKCGITQCGILYYFGDSRDYSASDTTGFDSEQVISAKVAIGLLVDNIKIKNFACGKLYESKLIKDIKFHPGKFFEDSYWQYKVVCSPAYSRYGILPIAGYKYRQRQSSITGAFSLRSIDLLEGSLEMCLYIKDSHPEYFQRCVYRLWKNMIWCESGIRQNSINIGKQDKERIENIQKTFDEMSYCLDNLIEYRIWKKSPFIYRIYVKLIAKIK